jgi:hypothetical protein
LDDPADGIVGHAAGAKGVPGAVVEEGEAEKGEAEERGAECKEEGAGDKEGGESKEAGL